MWSRASLTVSQGRESPGLVEGPSLRKATRTAWRERWRKPENPGLLCLLLYSSVQCSIQWNLHITRQTSLLHYRLLHHIKSYRQEVWCISLILTKQNLTNMFVLNKGRLGKETHICSARVKHVSDSFAHFEQQQTCSLRFVGVLLQIWEHVTQQGINIWSLCDTTRQHFITEAQERKAHPPVWHLLTCEELTFLIKKEKLSAANLRMCSFLCANSALYKLWGEKKCLFLPHWKKIYLWSLHRVRLPSYFSPVDIAHVLHHEPPQVLVEVGEASESPLQELCVLGVQQWGDQNEEVREVGVKVSLQVSGQLHHQAGGAQKRDRHRWSYT